MAENPLKKTTARVFLAIPFHGVFRQEMENILRPLSREISGVRWAEARQVHLTLHFFGAVSMQEIELIHLSSKKVASFFSPLKLTLSRIGGFPSLEKPDLIWLGVEESTGRLLSLQKALQGEVRTLGFKTESRPFQPHVTIGRVKRKSQDLKALLAKAPLKWPMPVKSIDHMALYQSHNLPEGAHYEILGTYPLSKKESA